MNKKDHFFDIVNHELSKVENHRGIKLGHLNSRIGKMSSDDVVEPFGESTINETGKR